VQQTTLAACGVGCYAMLCCEKCCAVLHCVVPCAALCCSSTHLDSAVVTACCKGGCVQGTEVHGPDALVMGLPLTHRATICTKGQNHDTTRIKPQLAATETQQTPLEIQRMISEQRKGQPELGIAWLLRFLFGLGPLPLLPLYIHMKWSDHWLVSDWLTRMYLPGLKLLHSVKPLRGLEQWG